MEFQKHLWGDACYSSGRRHIRSPALREGGLWNPGNMGPGWFQGGWEDSFCPADQPPVSSSSRSLLLGRALRFLLLVGHGHSFRVFSRFLGTPRCPKTSKAVLSAPQPPFILSRPSVLPSQPSHREVCVFQGVRRLGPGAVGTDFSPDPRSHEEDLRGAANPQWSWMNWQARGAPVSYPQDYAITIKGCFTGVRL